MTYWLHVLWDKNVYLSSFLCLFHMTDGYRAAGRQQGVSFVLSVVGGRVIQEVLLFRRSSVKFLAASLQAAVLTPLLIGFSSR